MEDKKETKVRIKLYLFKDEEKNCESFFKEKGRKLDEENIDGKVIYCYSTPENSPRWVKTFFGAPNEMSNLKNKSACCCYKENVMYEDKEYSFLISFGGADAKVDESKFVDDFGIRVGFNLIDKVASVSKSNISTTNSKNKEVSNKKSNLNEFVFDFENDLLDSITIKPKNNIISDSNFICSKSLSFATKCTKDNIHDTLIEILKAYNSNEYKEKYEFIDNIKCVKDQSIISKIQEKIVTLLINKEFNRVWFGSPNFDDFEYISFFKMNNGKEEYELSDLYVDVICNYIKIESYKQLKRIKIEPIYDDNRPTDIISLEDCLYGDIEIDGVEYVINSNRIYSINKDYSDRINNEYNRIIKDLSIESKFDVIKYTAENEFNKKAAENDSNIVNMDTNFYMINKNNIELCDLYDKENNYFYHIKIFGSSALLSHLFRQMVNAASIYKNDSNNVINYYKNKDNRAVELPEWSDNFTFIAGILSKEPNKATSSLPFFSKMTLISTFKEFKLINCNYKIMFIKADKIKQ